MVLSDHLQDINTKIIITNYEQNIIFSVCLCGYKKKCDLQMLRGVAVRAVFEFLPAAKVSGRAVK